MGVLIALVIGCGASAPPVAELSGGSPVDGQARYTEKCVGCHGIDGLGEDPLYLVPEMSETELWEVIFYGTSGMPSYASDYSTQDIADVIAFLRELKL